MYKNILFDLDGTMTNSAEGITKCVQHALTKLGIDEPDLSKLEVFIGPPLLDSFMKYYGLDKETAQKGVELYRSRYTDIGIWENFPYEGMVELLRDLQVAGYKTGMCTAKPEVFAVRIAERFGLSPYLDAETGCDLEGKMNNKALVVAASLAKWNITDAAGKTETVLIGDRREDILAAHANGIDCIGVRYGFAKPGELEEAGADEILPTVQSLREYFL